MQTASAVRAPRVEALPLNPKMLRQWCSPEVILAVTDLTDEDVIQLHAIQQARQNMAKVLLVHVDPPPTARSTTPKQSRAIVSLTSTQERVERMARQLRWSGVTCEPLVVRGLQANEISAIAKSCCADRVLVSAPVERRESAQTSCGIMRELVQSLDVPICVVGRKIPIVPRYRRPTRRITLMVSLSAHDELPIVFAGRFAQENHSLLALMHVYPKRTQKETADRTPADAASRLPIRALREAESFCPVEIVVREGDPAEQILKYDSSVNQDFIILAPVRDAEPGGLGLDSVEPIVRQARCPVFVVRESGDAHETSMPVRSTVPYAL